MIEVDSDGETVLVAIDAGMVKLSTREAFDFVTDLLRAIDCARGYGEAMRREVPNPALRGGPKNYRRARP